jgi:hypothetical protein
MHAAPTEHGIPDRLLDPQEFSDSHISLIQHNARASWRHLGPDVEVLVIGEDPGVAEAAGEHGAAHLDEPAVNEFGTPLLDWLFSQASGRSAGHGQSRVAQDRAQTHGHPTGDLTR